MQSDGKFNTHSAQAKAGDENVVWNFAGTLSQYIIPEHLI